MSNDEDTKELIVVGSGALTQERHRLIKRGLDALSVRRNIDRSSEDELDNNFVETASFLIESADYDEAERVLRRGIASMPPNWRLIHDSGHLEMRFWNMGEFEAYAKYQESLGSSGRSFFWTSPSYSKAHFLLAYLAIEQGDSEKALDEINKGVALEPDHPKMLGEKAFILRRLGRPAEALDVYVQAAASRSEWFPIAARAEALRGQGFCLMDLGRLESAETALRESLQIDPKNTAAINALDHLAELRSAEEEDEELPRSEASITQLLQSMAQRFDEVEERAKSDTQWRAARANAPLYQNTTVEERKANQVAAFEAYLREGKEGIRKHLDRMRDKKQKGRQGATQDDIK